MIKAKITGSGLAPQAAQVLAGTLSASLSATGSTQSTALPVYDDHNIITTTPAGAGVILRADLSSGDQQAVANLGANSLVIYPPIGGSIQGGAINAGVSLAAGAAADYLCINNLSFYSK